MDRREFLAATSAAAGATLAGCANLTSSQPDRPTYKNPVFEPILADPTAFRAEDGTFYAYGTEDNWHDGEGPRVVPIVKSENLVDWTYVGEAFAEKPDWKEGGNVWAPDINYIDGRYVLYYSLSKWGDKNPGIGVATADSPEGPFTDQGVLIRSKEIGVPNSIDPFYIEDEGTPYLFWGSFNGIYGIELGEDRMSLKGDKFQIAGNRFEGTYIEKHDGTYYLFVSSGTCCDGSFSTYQVEVGRSDSLRGPYVNSRGNDLMFFAGDVILKEGEDFAGPGHNTMVTDDAGDRWLLYHAYEKDEYYIQNTPRRPLCLDPLTWESGWPTVPDQTPSTKREGPVIENAN